MALLGLYAWSAWRLNGPQTRMGLIENVVFAELTGLTALIYFSLDEWWLNHRGLGFFISIFIGFAGKPILGSVLVASKKHIPDLIDAVLGGIVDRIRNRAGVKTKEDQRPNDKPPTK